MIDVLHQVAHTYAPDMVDYQMRDVKRAAFHIELALGGLDPKGLSLCDIGGGTALFAPACAALGIKTVLMDEAFYDFGGWSGNDTHAVANKHGVRTIVRDVIAEGVDIGESFDVVTTFASLEHWHHSPKKMLHQVVDKLLKPGGKLVIGVPNSVNLRKRITAPFGHYKWSSMEEWYEKPVFRDHVREPDVDDLLYIARDLKLKDVHVYGRNWCGFTSKSRVTRIATAITDLPLRLFPTLCSDIYVTGITM